MGFLRKGVVGLFGLALFALMLLGVLAATATSAAPGSVVEERIGQHVRQSAADLAPGEVLIGMYVQNLQAIDPATNSFLADVVVWYRWKDPNLQPQNTVEFVNLYEAWQLTEFATQEEPIPQPDGSLYFTRRYQGAFNSPLSLVKFPFGEQELHLILEDYEDETDKFRFVTDNESISIDDRITLPGYNIGTPSITVMDDAYNTQFGELDNTATNIYSQATVTIPISHPGLPNVVKYLLPILLVVIAASLVFQIPPTMVEARIGLGITAVLTLVAMQWSSSEGLPVAGYLMMLDVLYIIALVFILATLIQGIRTTWQAREGREAEAIASDERMMYVYLGIYLLVSGAVLAAYLIL